MNLSRRQLLGSAAAVGAAACLPSAALAEPVRTVSLYEFHASKLDGDPFWQWFIKYSVNDGEIRTKQCETERLSVELDGGVWLEMNEQPEQVGIVGSVRPPDDPMEWMFDGDAAYVVPDFWKNMPKMPLHRCDVD
jgi:hypothetical protein